MSNENIDTGDANQRSFLQRIVRYPRGRYNGRRITGFDVKFSYHWDITFWIPKCSWGYGEPYFTWLGFGVRANANYHHMDK